jgi:thiamine biosynthesis lipoprotein
MDSSTRIARKMAALAGLGFQRVDASPIPSGALRISGNRHRVTSSQPSMGTLVSVTAIHSSKELVEEAVGRAYLEMDRVVELLNRHDPASAVCSLNDQGMIRGPPPELSCVLGQALSFNRISRGAFDPTVQPLVDLVRARRAPHTSGATPPVPPSRTEILEALELVDAGAVEVASRWIRLGKTGMGVTLDGIAKGYVVDRMAVVLQRMGLSDFLINAGGDIRSAGLREDGRAWQVAVQDPEKGDGFPDVIPLTGMAVATSGGYEIFLDSDRDHHHIVSSRDGRSPQHSRSVSVVAPTAMEADALATSVFLMEPDRGAAFIDSIPQCACLVIDRHGRQVRSARWQGTAEPPTSKAGIL